MVVHLKGVEYEKENITFNIKNKWFGLIALGKKKIEYREIKNYWTERLTLRLAPTYGLVKRFDEVHFRNGYSKDVMKMIFEFKGVRRGEESYEILLGRVL